MRGLVRRGKLTQPSLASRPRGAYELGDNQESDAFTRSGVSGSSRMRRPVA
jgi:hypothetical protein